MCVSALSPTCTCFRQSSLSLWWWGKGQSWQATLQLPPLFRAKAKAGQSGGARCMLLSVPSNPSQCELWKSVPLWRPAPPQPSTIHLHTVFYSSCFSFLSAAFYALFFPSHIFQQDNSGWTFKGQTICATHLEWEKQLVQVLMFWVEGGGVKKWLNIY